MSVVDDNIETPFDVPQKRTRPPMPPEIAKAIIAVNKKVKSLAKDETNTFQRFKYTSVDAFYEAIGPLMAEAGLIVFTDEIDTQIERRESTDDQGRNKVSNWLITQYELIIYHESGAEWGPIRREMMVAATGPQAYGSGQSYVEKYFLRGLFKVPTGDGDADAQSKTELPARQRAPASRPRPPEPPHDPETGEVHGPHRIPLGDGANRFIEYSKTFVAAIKTSATRAELDAWQRECAAGLAAMSVDAPKAHRLVKANIAEQEVRLKPKEVELMTEADVGSALSQSAE